jgi:glycosyltransferase involved in cell wall biosynthesis
MRQLPQPHAGERDVSLSVVLPNYNHGHLILRALTAIARQAPDEIIVVDDASTDGSVAILQDFARTTPLTILRNPSNQGAVRALARGLAAASGRYVYFAAADDYVMPGFLARARDQLERHPAAGLFCGEARLVDGVTGRPIGLRPPVRPLRRAGFVDPAGARALLARIDNWILTGSAVFRRDAIVTLGGFDARLGAFADGYLARKVALTRGFCFAPEVVATWCIYNDSVSRQTALQVATARAMLDLLPQRIAADPVFPAWYAGVFARRWRFAAARLALEHPVDHELLAVMGAPSRLDRAAIGAIRRVARGRVAHLATLAWLGLRLRPTSLVGVATTALARRFERGSTRPQP